MIVCLSFIFSRWCQEMVGFLFRFFIGLSGYEFFRIRRWGSNLLLCIIILALEVIMFLLKFIEFFVVLLDHSLVAINLYQLFLVLLLHQVSLVKLQLVCLFIIFLINFIMIDPYWHYKLLTSSQAYFVFETSYSLLAS